MRRHRLNPMSLSPVRATVAPTPAAALEAGKEVLAVVCSVPAGSTGMRVTCKGKTHRKPFPKVDVDASIPYKTLSAGSRAAAACRSNRIPTVGSSGRPGIVEARW